MPLTLMAKRRRRTLRTAVRARRRLATAISRQRAASRRHFPCPIRPPASPRYTTRVQTARAKAPMAMAVGATDVPPRRAASEEHPIPGAPMRSELIHCRGRRISTNRARPACSPRVTTPTTGGPRAKEAGTGSASERGRRSGASARTAIGTLATTGRVTIRDKTVGPIRRTSTSCPRSASIPGRWYASMWTTTRIRSTKAQNTSDYLMFVLSSTLTLFRPSQNKILSM